jgi:hypothetical protein
MCNCNKEVKLQGHTSETKTAKSILKKMWENSQLLEKPVTTIKINKT